MPADETKRKSAPVATALGWLALLALVGGAFWLGVKALQDTEPAGSGAAPGGGGGFPPATVIVADVVEQPVQEFRQVTGTLRAVSRADVAAREAGAVDEILVDEGDTVEIGAPLARLDPRRVEAEIAESKALLTAARALVTQREAETKRAGTDLEMKQALIEERAVSRRELLDAEREIAVAEAQEQAARDQLSAVESRIALLDVRKTDLNITAPFAGRVVSRHVDPGEWLNPGEPVITLVSAGTVEVWLSVPERFSTAVNGNAFEVVVESLGRPVTAKAVRRVADVDTRTRQFPVVALLDDLDGSLVPGMSAYANLPIGEPAERLGVSADAVIETRSQAYVFRVAPAAEEGQLPAAEKVPVSIAFRRDGLIWLDPGNLKAGDQVVVEGNERLFPGTPLMASAGSAKEQDPVAPKAE